MKDLSSQENKSDVLKKVEAFIQKNEFSIVESDENRPWGGFFVIDEKQAPVFREKFFPHIQPAEMDGFAKLSPKILVVAPQKRLSWQYHHRRSEIWRVVMGSVGVVVSSTNDQTPVKKLSEGDHINLHQGERHRLVGLDNWGIVAEIWQHTDPENPSNESDIVRLEDDFGR